MPPTKESTFEVNIPDEIASLVSSIALGIMNMTIYHQSTYMILARKGTSFLSFGELVEVHIAPARVGVSKISMVSKSALSTTLIDWGTNAENLRRFEQLVKSLAGLVRSLEREKV